MEEDLYCKIYIYSKLDKEGLLKLLVELVGGDVSLRTVEGEIFEVSVMANDDYDEAKVKTIDEGNFVFYPYYFEIEPIDEDDVDRAIYKLAIGKLLSSLWSRDVNAVAACDFEDDLPMQVA